VQWTPCILLGTPRKILLQNVLSSRGLYCRPTDHEEWKAKKRLGLVGLDPKASNAPFLLPSQVTMTLRISRIRTIRHWGASIRTSLEIIARGDVRILIGPRTVGRQGRTGLMSMVDLFHFLLERPALRRMVRASHAGQQIQQKRQDVEGKYQCDNPFKHGGDILMTREGRARERDG